MPRETKTGTHVPRACILFLLLLLVQYTTPGACINEAYIRLLNQHYFALTLAESRQLMPAASYTASVQLCEDNGGVPPALTSTAAADYANQQCIRNGLGSLPHSFYTGANGDTTVTAAACDNESPYDPVSTSVCSFRFRFGFFDQFSYAGEPGAAFWHTYYRGNNEDRQRTLNFYEPFWSGVIQGYKVVPYGRKKLVGYSANGGIPPLVDIGETPISSDVMRSTDFVIACEVQNIIAGFFISTKMPQPVLRPLWHDVSWAKTHWYIFFIVVAGVITLGLVGVAVYCACTARSAPPGPPLEKLVMHDRLGKLYYTDASRRPTRASSLLANGGLNKNVSALTSAPSNERGEEAEEEEEMVVVVVEEDGRKVTRKIKRKGKGFNIPASNTNPLAKHNKEGKNNDDNDDGDDNNAVNVPTIYNTGAGTLIYSAGDSLAADLVQHLNNDPTGSNNGGDGEETTSVSSITRRTPSVRGRSATARRTRGRTTSNQFMDIEVPVADEIDEVDIDL